MRAFLAIEVPPVRVEGYPPPRPGAPSHVTLRFFANLAENRVADIAGIARRVAGAHRPFLIDFAGLGAFPSPERPRVLFARVATGREEVETIAAELEQRLAEVGLPGDGRPFAAHLTVARIRRPIEADRAREAIARVGDRPFGEATIEALYLMKSELGRDGPTHSILERAPLGATPSAA